LQGPRAHWRFVHDNRVCYDQRGYLTRRFIKVSDNSAGPFHGLVRYAAR
jgi:hypothetical protein